MRRRLRRLTAILVSLLLLGSTLGCATLPPGLSTEATLAYRGTQLIKALDVLRDFAVDANKQVPPLISTESMLQVVTYHRSMIVFIHDIPSGWKRTVQTGLDETMKHISEAERRQLQPYVILVETLIEAVP